MAHNGQPDDLYEILQVSPSAEPEVIEGASRRLSLKYHPDQNRDPGATERFKQIRHAYEVLRNPESRKMYDAGRRAAYRDSGENQPESQPGGGRSGAKETPNPVRGGPHHAPSAEEYNAARRADRGRSASRSGNAQRGLGGSQAPRTVGGFSAARATPNPPGGAQRRAPSAEEYNASRRAGAQRRSEGPSGGRPRRVWAWVRARLPAWLS